MKTKMNGLPALIFFAVVMFAANSYGQNLFSARAELLDGARNVYARQPAEGEYRVVRSAIKKVNNQWRANEERLFGQIIRNTWVLKDSMSYNEARNRLQDILGGAAEFDVLYRCAGLDCGSSNGLANQFLNIKQLYGLDEYQFYAVLEQKSRGGGRTVHVVYLVQRGNKRIYLQHDRIQAEREQEQRLGSEQIARLVDQYGTVRIASLELAADSDLPEARNLSWVAELLKNQRGWVVRCVGHSYDQASLSARTARSLAAANAVKQQLLEQGAPVAQVSAHGVGSLAPTSGTHPHVELLIERID